MTETKLLSSAQAIDSLHAKIAKQFRTKNDLIVGIMIESQKNVFF